MTRDTTMPMDRLYYIRKAALRRLDISYRQILNDLQVIHIFPSLLFNAFLAQIVYILLVTQPPLWAIKHTNVSKEKCPVEWPRFI